MTQLRHQHAWLRQRASAIFVAVALSLFAGAPSRLMADDATQPRVVTVFGFTSAARQAELASLQPAQIVRYLVEPGETVEEGQALVELDAEGQRAATEIARLDAASTLDIELAEVEWERAQRELTRLRNLGGSAEATSRELDEAEALARAGALRVAIAKLDHERAQQVWAQQQHKLAQLTLSAPFSGYVVRCEKEAGDALDEMEVAVEVVQLDPLRVELDCPLAAALTLEAGETALVHPSDAAWTAREGRVRYVSRVVDAASQTCKVRLDVPNGDGGWIAGMRVALHVELDPAAIADLALTQARPKPGALGDD